MGDRANIFVQESSDPSIGVYLYTHWEERSPLHGHGSVRRPVEFLPCLVVGMRRWGWFRRESQRR